MSAIRSFPTTDMVPFKVETALNMIKLYKQGRAGRTHFINKAMEDRIFRLLHLGMLKLFGVFQSCCVLGL